MLVAGLGEVWHPRSWAACEAMSRVRTLPSGLAAAALLAVIAAGVAAATAAAIGSPVPEQVPTADTGREIWLRDCAVCHGERGQGSDDAPPIVDVGTAGIDFMLRTGRMPLAAADDEAKRGPSYYSPAEINALLAYTGRFIEGPDVPGVDVTAADVARGGDLYRLNCASCHQMTGQGGVLIAGTDVPPLRAADAVEAVEAIRVGPNNMPAFPETLLDAEEVRDIVAYLGELDAPEDPGGWSLGHWGPVPEGAAALVFGLIPVVVVARVLGQRNPQSAQEDERR